MHPAAQVGHERCPEAGPADLRVPARASRGVTAARGWFAPGLLRQTGPGLAWHLVDLAQPNRASARGQPSTQPAAGLVQLCPRDGVW